MKISEQSAHLGQHKPKLARPLSVTPDSYKADQCVYNSLVLPVICYTDTVSGSYLLRAAVSNGNYKTELCITVYHCVSLSEVIAPRSNNFECDWLIELSDDKLSYNNLASGFVENRSF